MSLFRVISITQAFKLTLSPTPSFLPLSFASSTTSSSCEERNDCESLKSELDRISQHRRYLTPPLSFFSPSFPLISQMTNQLFAVRYGKAEYTSAISTRVSNALLVGAVLGQVSVGLVTDRVGRKSAIVITTLVLTLGAIFATAAYPVNGNLSNLWWWLTVARGALGVGVGGEYACSSASASEAANERYGQKQRSTIFIFCTNFVLSFGG